MRWPEGTPNAGEVLTVEFEIEGRMFTGLNGGPQFKFNEAISLMVHCKDQKEVDATWDALLADGGEPSMCGWLKDKFGVSWQVIPDGLLEAMTNPDKAKAGRAMQVMMTQRKLDIDAIRQAMAG
jgi:predicted 3-demethylubiquinone-9 3-methyltransferase (glyoxalase superfamily)